MKSNNRRSGKRCHGLAGLPLFDWRQTLPRRPSTPAGAYVTRKFGVPIAIAGVAADLKDWLGDLDAAEALRREQLDQIAELRAQVYRRAKARGVTPTMLRQASASAEVTAMADDLEAEIATLEADAERENLDIKRRLSRLSTQLTDLKPTLKVVVWRTTVASVRSNSRSVSYHHPRRRTANVPAALAAAEFAADPVKFGRRGSEAMAQHHYYHRYDRAAYLANAIRLIFITVDKPEEQQRQVEQTIRDEIADIERQIAADRDGC